MLQLIPISDRNPTRKTPFVTIALIVINLAVFFLLEPNFGTGLEADRYFFENAPVSCQLEDDCPAGYTVPDDDPILIPERDTISFLGAVLFSAFLHAGFLHLAGNMLFLWVFGNNIEDFLGPVKYLIFYLLGGIAAAFTHIVPNLDAAVPLVGASGAVAAVMGAYILLHPRARVRVLVPIFILWTILEWPAFAVLGLWFAYQFFIAYQESTAGTGVAWLAHVGGFVFGLIAIWLFGGRPQKPQSTWSEAWRYR